MPAGYAALIERYDLILPLPSRLSAIAERHHPGSTDAWLMQTPRHQPEVSLAGHLTYAFRYEGIDLAVLWQLFHRIDTDDIAAMVRAKPTGSFARRAWFLFEWLTGQRLDLPDAGKIRLVPVVDRELQFAIAEGDPSPRHKVANNLPGTQGFCPLVRRTPTLIAFEKKALASRARDVIGRTRPDLIARAAAFMLFNDSKSSFEIDTGRSWKAIRRRSSR